MNDYSNLFICEISARYLEMVDDITPLLQTLLSFFSGIIDFLVSQHPIAKVLRDHLVFKIAPMLNPDGVYLGNYRYGIENEFGVAVSTLYTLHCFVSESYMPCFN